LENKEIIRSLRKTAAFMEITGANAFKVRAVTNAIFSLERVDKKISTLTQDELASIDGVGKSLARQIHEISQSGTSGELEKLTNEIPVGVQEMQGIGGLGAKKIRQLWQEHDIDSIEALQKFIDSGQLTHVKGFGDKTIRQISEAIEFRRDNAHKMLLPEALKTAEQLETSMQEQGIRFERTGQLARKEPVITEFTYLVEVRSSLSAILGELPDVQLNPLSSSPFNLRGTLAPKDIAVRFRIATPENWGNLIVQQIGPVNYLQQPVLKETLMAGSFASQQEVFAHAELPESSPEVRGYDLSEDSIINSNNIKGILHAHSTYSDGQQSLEEMVLACQTLGYEYFGITDHSRSSYFYANGLFENRVMDQFKEIDQLREKYPDFTIFKGIECDILTDGNLDYANDILGQFDFIIASVHSVLNMDIETATRRLTRAIENPYTTMLGHISGRLLLRRRGYPVHMPTIIDACAANEVSIELNANPNRLDVDYTWIPQILDKGIKISINPDAHSIKGFEDVWYGINMARKAGVNAKDNLTSYSAMELKDYFANRRKSRIS
jgi:DNA polymerase (family 10)